MTTYNGPAVLLLDDGRQFDTTADLAKDARGSWRGTLTFHDESLFPVLLNADEGHVLVDGRPGEFIRPDRNDWTINNGSPFIMQIPGQRRSTVLSTTKRPLPKEGALSFTRVRLPAASPAPGMGRWPAPVWAGVRCARVVQGCVRRRLCRRGAVTAGSAPAYRTPVLTRRSR
jgi:hypothetical protein